MNTTGILTLISQTHELHKCPMKYAQGNNINFIKLDNDFTIVPQICDLLQITHLLFESHLQLEQFETELQNCIFEITLNGNKFMEIPIKWLSYLNKITYQKNNNNGVLHKYYITFPDFLFKLNMMSIKKDHVKIKCSVPNSIVSSSLVVQTIYLDSNIRKKMAFNQYSKMHQHLYQSVPNVENNKMIFKISTHCYTKGYFIYGKSICDINSISIVADGHELLKYDKDLIILFCKQINENMLYLPHNFEKKYYHVTLDSFIGALNNKIVDYIKIIIEFTNNEIICNMVCLGLEYVNYNLQDSQVNNSSVPTYPITTNFCLEKNFIAPPDDWEFSNK